VIGRCLSLRTAGLTVATQKQRKSWIYRHGYRVALLNLPKRKFFVCKYCHQHKIIDAGGSGIFEVSKATTAASTHLGQPTKGHNLTKNGARAPVQLPRGQESLVQLFKSGIGLIRSLPTRWETSTYSNFDSLQCFGSLTTITRFKSLNLSR
jgi:hypothetical protein